MPDIAEDEVVEIQGSAAAPYKLRNIAGVYSCTCPAWINAGGPVDMRTCKHLKAYRGEDVELARVGANGGGAGSKPASSLKMPVAASKAAAKAVGDDDDAAGEGAPPVLLAHKWENDIDLNGWWMSEKLDGVRAWWDGQRFYSRLGNAFLAPAWFTKDLPKHPLDGELWLARQEFQRCVSIVRSANAGELWREVKYLVFDAPTHQVPFEQRIDIVHNLFGSGQSEFAVPVTHVQCSGIAHLRQELGKVEALGGEGLMLRQPGSKYVNGRSSTLLKVKTFHDAEARVVSHDPGKGKHKGRLGALVCEMHDGTRFNVGTGFTDAERQSPPQVGDIVTYRYQELTKDGVPRFPSYVGVATDKTAPTVPPKGPLVKPALSTSTTHGPTVVMNVAAASASSVPSTKVTSAGTTAAAASASASSSSSSFGKPASMPAPASKPAPAPAPKPAPVKAAVAPDDDDDEEIGGDDDDEGEIGGDEGGDDGGTIAPRRFEVDEKFWVIALDGASTTVTFGKIGTAGQTKVKDFDDEGAAKKEYDKLVREKTNKGYVEVKASAPAAAPAPAAKPAPAPAAKPAAAPAPAKPAASSASGASSAWSSKPAAAPSSSKSSTGPAAVVKALSDGWRKSQWDDIEALLDEQMVIIKPDGDRVEGRDDCLRTYQDFVKHNKIVRFAEADHRLDVWGNTAMASCRWEMTYVSAGRPKREKGTETLALTSDDGTFWRVVWRRLDVASVAAAAVEEDEGDDDEEEDEDFDDEE